MFKMLSERTGVRSGKREQDGLEVLQTHHGNQGTELITASLQRLLALGWSLQRARSKLTSQT